MKCIVLWEIVVAALPPKERRDNIYGLRVPKPTPIGYREVPWPRNIEKFDASQQQFPVFARVCELLPIEGSSS